MSIKSPPPEPDAPIRWTRRGFFGAGLGVGAGLGLPLLAGCSSDPYSDTSGILKMAGRSFGAFTGTGEITREQVAVVPYASIGVRVGDSNQVLLALVSKSRGFCLWTSAARIAIETDGGGRITRTAGLPHNMAQSSADGSDPLQAGIAGRGGGCEYYIDLPDRNVWRATVRYRLESPEQRETVILGANLKVQYARERGACSDLLWEFQNEYWRDAATGFMWRSRQAIHPDLDVVEITILRRPL
ncbi:MAG TPA: YjbF family lipoprotein [Rhizomicrobium sp.]